MSHKWKQANIHSDWRDDRGKMEKGVYGRDGLPKEVIPTLIISYWLSNNSKFNLFIMNWHHRRVICSPVWCSTTQAISSSTVVKYFIGANSIGGFNLNEQIIEILG